MSKNQKQPKNPPSNVTNTVGMDIEIVYVLEEE